MKNKTHETAGHLMVKNIPVIELSAKVRDVEKMLLEKTKIFETINYIYVIDEQKKFKGVLSIKELFLSAKNAPIQKLRLKSKELVTVTSHTDQERVALLALKHNLKAIPVVDVAGKLLGVVENDRIIQILHDEGVENMLRMGGMTKMKLSHFDNVFNLSLWTSIKHRLPWLILGLGGGILLANVVTSFEEVISKNLILAAYIPLIVYMASAVGTQMEAFIIRDLAINPNLKLGKYFLRQALIVTVIGIIVSLLLFILDQILYENSNVSLTLMIGLFAAIISSLFTGLLVPYLFGKMKLDPANASGPIATIIQDILSISIYFVIASWLLL